ncbi:hypothetical protein H0I76_11495 [Limibaculum sp. M0105]|uniref:Helix-turn-helix domain-containing protein n=1 Tax=Thermohalobaculum xanthum TaxID=2753746 RepID=A0A8J7M7N5_9RHOB|nr:hypothetical protein [Thermohalobaculum xanthum]MBK0399816.1 hypothetical protein [Thermohalobaculum xanthum]
MARKNRKGRTEFNEHFAKMLRSTMEEPAWRALSTAAQSLYPWIKLEWHGPSSNNNGKIRFSVRQAAQAVGCDPGTARRAFCDLQAKGFLHVTKVSSLGSEGEARGNEYEITELALPGAIEGRKLYRSWRPGRDFPVQRAKANNPKGKGGFGNSETRPQDADQSRASELQNAGWPDRNSQMNTPNIDNVATAERRHPYLPEGCGERAASGCVRATSAAVGAEC